MKGVFLKLEQGWVIEYIFDYQREFISLHPSDYITNKTQRVDGKEVEFEIVHLSTDPLGRDVKPYAKIINVDKLGNEDVPKLGNDVDKLALELYPIEFHPIMEGSYDINREQREAFVKGCNKTKETLYTKEDVLKAGEIGEINHHDYKHIASLLDEAKAINQSLKNNKK